MRIATQNPSLAREQIRSFIFEMTKVEGTDLNEQYFHLINEHFGLLSEAERHEIIRTILRGPNLNTDVEQQKIFGRRPSEEEIGNYIRRWKIFRLYPIK